ncbi:hypothetical protein NL676_015723 [Syzygium grande]|nr:hypothetical protein NL676_015723 [Syzygium grande]
MDVAPIASSELHRQHEFFSFLFLEDLEAYKLNPVKIEEEAVLRERAIVLEDRAAFVSFVVEWHRKMVALAEKRLT